MFIARSILRPFFPTVGFEQTHSLWADWGPPTWPVDATNGGTPRVWRGFQNWLLYRNWLSPRSLLQRLLDSINTPVVRDQLEFNDITRAVVQESLRGKLSFGEGSLHQFCLANYHLQQSKKALPTGYSAVVYCTIKRAAIAGDIEIIQPGFLAEKAEIFRVDVARLRVGMNRQISGLSKCFFENPLFHVCDDEEVVERWLLNKFSHFDWECATSDGAPAAQEHRAVFEADDHLTWLDERVLSDQLPEDVKLPWADWEETNDMALLWPDPPVSTKPASEKTSRMVRLVLEQSPTRSFREQLK